MLTFMPQFVLGYQGMPRRYPYYPEEWQLLNILSTAGASIQGVGYVMPFFYLTASLFTGRDAGPNPWRATGLEWQTSSPPPQHNFEDIPVVTHPPYEYSLPSRWVANGAPHETNGHAGTREGVTSGH
jgi:cytochrome c oxidase subunit 1